MAVIQSAARTAVVVAVVFLICCQQHPIDRPSSLPFEIYIYIYIYILLLLLPVPASSPSFALVFFLSLSQIYEDKETIRSYICGTKLALTVWLHSIAPAASRSRDHAAIHYIYIYLLFILLALCVSTCERKTCARRSSIGG